MLKSIRFKFGPTPDAAPIQITPGPMTVIVGPNNSGKSLTLRELDRSLQKAETDWETDRWSVLADIEPALPSSGSLRIRILDAIQSDLANLRAADTPGLKLLGQMSAANNEETRQLNYWLNIINNKPYAETLLARKRLRRPASMTNASIELPSSLHQAASSAGLFTHKLAAAIHEDPWILQLIHAIDERTDDEAIADGFIDLRGYYDLYAQQCQLLDGEARLELSLEERSESLHDVARGTIMRLWHARQDLERLRELVLDAFGKHLCVDITSLRHARLVLSDKSPPPGIEDRLDAEARAFFAAARPLDDFSDGVRTYIGLHAELIAQDRRFVMIDEPEAFLHPPLARRLGFNLSTLAAERGSCVFAATHSPDFLMGCIDSGVDVNIVRLGYRNGVPSAHLLPQDELRTLMVDPLLRSTGILGALFHQAAVVVEGDSDRVFYGEINERLRLHEPAHPAVMRDCVFLNAQGKATVSRILAALRRLGVVSCGIVDLDLLKDSKVCSNLLRAAGAPESVCSSIGYTRSQVQHSVRDLADLCKPGGLARATPEERKGILHFIREMESHAIFLPEVGPVEGWLSELGVVAQKNAWIAAIFDAMGPIDAGMKPGRGDVWQFIRHIGQTLEHARDPRDPTT